MTVHHADALPAADIAAEVDCRLAEIAADFAIEEAESERDMAACGFAAQVGRAEARRDLAYDLARARLEQALARERVGIVKVERQERLWVEELEILRKEKELVHSVRLPADAECYRLDALTQAECRRVLRLAEADAEAIRLRGLAQAEAIRAVGVAEAEVIRQKALAEAEGLRARLLAEAEGLREKAAASEQVRPSVIVVQVPAAGPGHHLAAEGVGT